MEDRKEMIKRMNHVLRKHIHGQGNNSWVTSHRYTDQEIGTMYYCLEKGRVENKKFYPSKSLEDKPIKAGGLFSGWYNGDTAYVKGNVCLIFHRGRNHDKWEVIFRY